MCVYVLLMQNIGCCSFAFRKSGADAAAGFFFLLLFLLLFRLIRRFVYDFMVERTIRKQCVGL